SAAVAGEPRALAAGDLDRDGMPDLAVGLATPQGGRIVIYPGNLDHLFPNQPEAKARRDSGLGVDEPFLSAATVVELDRAPDFLAIGDFDADGAADLVAATLGADRLDLAPGDGSGRLGALRPVNLGGAITALAAGEIDQRDLLPDLAVALVDRAGRAEVVLLAGAQGAANALPERLPLASPAHALLLDALDGDTSHDLAAATEDAIELHFGLGEVPGALAERRGRRAGAARLPFTASALASGDFARGEAVHRRELALLDRNGDLRVLRIERGAEGQAVHAERGQLPAFAAPGSSRLVPAHLNSDGGAQLLAFGGADGSARIAQLDLPARQRGAGRERLALDTVASPVAALALRLNPDPFADLVVLVEGSAEPLVLATRAASIFTVDDPGTAADCNTNDGVCTTDAGAGCGTGGCTLHAAIQQANASAGADAIQFALGAPGSSHLITTFSEWISESVTIDATTQPGYAGVPLIHSSEPLISQAGSHTFRGFGLVAGNQGVYFSASTSNSFAEGNRIGAAMAQPGPAMGFNLMAGPSNITLGGAAAAARNVIFCTASGNLLDLRGSGHVVRNNWFGLDPTGAFVSADADVVYLYGANNVSFLDNVVTGGTSLVFGRTAVSVLGGSGLVFQGNFVGTDATGNADSGAPLSHGMVAAPGPNEPSNATIGGSAPGQGNVFAGNAYYGLWFHTAATGNVVRGNKFGVGADGTTALGNGLAGLRVGYASTSGITVGGTGAGEGNLFAHNGGAGVLVQDGWNHRIRGNSMFDNAGLGIDLTSQGNNAGVSPNDLGDADGGDWDGHGNQYQNFPHLAAAGGTSVAGGLDSAASTTYALDFYSSPACDGSGHGEAKVYLGSIQVTTNASGSAPFVAAVAALADGDFVTATAIDPNGNTSEISACIETDSSLIFADGFGSETWSAWSATVP
ncbi:MAG: SpaA 2 protein, partial [Acidobacteriota bacterium]|nr:SpaA 2 protein [Acidobacteriota bacterium]